MIEFNLEAKKPDLWTQLLTYEDVRKALDEGKLLKIALYSLVDEEVDYHSINPLAAGSEDPTWWKAQFINKGKKVFSHSEKRTVIFSRGILHNQVVTFHWKSKKELNTFLDNYPGFKKLGSLSYDIIEDKNVEI